MAAAMHITGMTLGELLGDAAGAYSGVRITDLVLDSEAVTPGAAFLALPGARTHGLDHAPRAIARGASIVLYEPPADGTRPDIEGLAVPGLKARLGELAQLFFPAVAAMTLTGVTGTNGKSTVAWLVAEAMNATGRGSRGMRCGYIGTLGFGVPPQLAGHALTTPDCLTLHRELTEMATSHAALEVSSHALAQDRVAGLRFAVAVFTNLTHDHLDAHGDFESYGRAKARLFHIAGLSTAVLNLNDPFARRLRGELAGTVDVIGTLLDAAVPDAAVPDAAVPDAAVPDAVKPPHDSLLVGRLLSTNLSGTRLAVSWQGREAQWQSPLIGRFNAENLLSALGALLANGLDLDEACAALGNAAPPPGRMEVVAHSDGDGNGNGAGNGPVVVVDYAHTPDALQRVLTELKAMTAGRLICVFGCGGERDRAKRPLMGEAAARHADRIVLTDDNPRGENPDAIIADIRGGIAAGTSVTVQRDRARAIADAIAQAATGDVVVVAGKGHESEQLSGTQRLPFSDRAAVRAALRERRSRP